jgi:hypothetical protein
VEGQGAAHLHQVKEVVPVNPLLVDYKKSRKLQFQIARQLTTTLAHQRFAKQG